jgi:hypothetical protein
VLRYAAQHGALHYAHKDVHEQAMADSQTQHAMLFNAQNLAKHFSDSSDSMLPHRSKAAPNNSQYWGDPITQLVHHQLPELSNE